MAAFNSNESFSLPQYEDTFQLMMGQLTSYVVNKGVDDQNLGCWLGHNSKAAKAPLPELFWSMSHARVQGKKLFIGSKSNTFGGMAFSLAPTTSFFMI